MTEKPKRLMYNPVTKKYYPVKETSSNFKKEGELKNPWDSIKEDSK